jgi:hypothetical protein
MPVRATISATIRSRFTAPARESALILHLFISPLVRKTRKAQPSLLLGYEYAYKMHVYTVKRGNTERAAFP